LSLILGEAKTRGVSWDEQTAAKGIVRTIRGAHASGSVKRKGPIYLDS